MGNRIAVLLVLAITLFSCGKEESLVSDPLCIPDRDGNLIINNRVQDTLLLYTDELSGFQLHKKIAGNDDMEILIPSGDRPVTLLLWKKSEIGDDAEPNMESVYRIWNTVLPEFPKTGEEVVWTIEEADAVRTGTLKLDYDAIDYFDQRVIYNVDVILNFPNASPIVSIYPGTENKVVPIPFGVYTLYFRYWYSNPNDAEHLEEIGFISTDEAGDQIRLVINGNFDESTVTVPPFLTSGVGKFGCMEVINNTDDIVFIKANGRLIEEFNINSNSSSTATSFIPDSTHTKLLVDEGEYNIEIYPDQSDTDLISLFPDFTIVERYKVLIKVGDYDYKEMVIINRTDQAITIHNQAGEYLGCYIKPNDQRKVQFSETGSLEARGYSFQGKKYIPLGTNSFVVDALN